MLDATEFSPLTSMSIPQRLGFALGCAQRVLDVYAGVASPYSSKVDAAFREGWRAVREVDAAAPAAARAKGDVDALITPLLDEPELEYGALMALSRALEVLSSPGPTPAEQSALQAASTVERADRGRLGALEEDAWQREWLRFCAAAKPADIEPEFRARNAQEPAWLQRWRDQ